MKNGNVVFFHVSALSLIIIFALPCFAQSNSFSSTTTNTSTTGANTSSWQQSASDAAHNAKVGTEKVYNQAAHSVKDISLQARIKAVLHENKSTRDSNVRVTADNGIVTLTGGVPSEQDAQHVKEVVASVYGVKAVDNDLDYPHSRRAITPSDADSMGIAHPAYSDTAPAENAPLH
jgi:BON domain